MVKKNQFKVGHIVTPVRHIPLYAENSVEEDRMAEDFSRQYGNKIFRIEYIHPPSYEFYCIYCKEIAAPFQHIVEFHPEELAIVNNKYKRSLNESTSN